MGYPLKTQSLSGVAAGVGLTLLHSVGLMGCIAPQDERSVGPTIRFVTYARDPNAASSPQGLASPTPTPSRSADNGGITLSAVAPSSVSLSWSDVADKQAYHVYRDQNLVATVTEAHFDDSGLAPQSTYLYQVVAVTADGIVDPIATPLSVTTPSSQSYARSISLTPTDAGILPTFEGSPDERFNATLTIMDSGVPISQSQLYRLTPKSVSDINRQSSACSARIFTDLSTAAQPRQVSYCMRGGAAFQELTPIGDALSASEAMRSPPAAITFSHPVSAGALPLGASILAIVLTDSSGGAVLVTRSLQLTAPQTR